MFSRTNDSSARDVVLENILEMRRRVWRMSYVVNEETLYVIRWLTGSQCKEIPTHTNTHHPCSCQNRGDVCLCMFRCIYLYMFVCVCRYWVSIRSQRELTWMTGKQSRERLKATAPSLISTSSMSTVTLRPLGESPTTASHCCVRHLVIFNKNMSRLFMTLYFFQIIFRCL